MLKYILLVILIVLGWHAYNTVDFKTVVPDTVDALKNTSLINNVNTKRENRSNELKNLGY